MTQITFRGQAATIATTSEAITTGNVQQLPAWAPPIESVGTTSPWKLIVQTPTTATGIAKITEHKVQQYGTKVALHGGVSVFTTDILTADAAKLPIITLTYRAIGELSRPE